MPSDDSLVVKPKPPSMRKGIALNRFKAEQVLKSIDPNTVTNRLGLVMDDSGSMSGQPIQDAHTAIKNFTLFCNMEDTSITVYPLNAVSKPLTVDYDVLNLYVTGIGAIGGTYLYTTLLKMIESENITRAVVFSDGEPTDARLVGKCEGWDSKPKDFALSCIKKYTDKEIPIDCIYIGIAASSGYKEMEELAKITGGIFVHFQDSLSLSIGLKYLAPRYRALLANAELKSKIEKGENI